jgi:hypothetical protein
MKRYVFRYVFLLIICCPVFPAAFEQEESLLPRAFDGVLVPSPLLSPADKVKFFLERTIPDVEQKLQIAREEEDFHSIGRIYSFLTKNFKEYEKQTQLMLQDLYSQKDFSELAQSVLLEDDRCDVKKQIVLLSKIVSLLQINATYEDVCDNFGRRIEAFSVDAPAAVFLKNAYSLKERLELVFGVSLAEINKELFNQKIDAIRRLIFGVESSPSRASSQAVGLPFDVYLDRCRRILSLEFFCNISNISSIIDLRLANDFDFSVSSEDIVDRCNRSVCDLFGRHKLQFDVLCDSEKDGSLPKKVFSKKIKSFFTKFVDEKLGFFSSCSQDVSTVGFREPKVLDSDVILLLKDLVDCKTSEALWQRALVYIQEFAGVTGCQDDFSFIKKKLSENRFCVGEVFVTMVLMKHILKNTKFVGGQTVPRAFIAAFILALKAIDDHPYQMKDFARTFGGQTSQHSAYFMFCELQALRALNFQTDPLVLEGILLEDSVGVVDGQSLTVEQLLAKLPRKIKS